MVQFLLVLTTFLVFPIQCWLFPLKAVQHHWSILSSRKSARTSLAKTDFDKLGDDDEEQTSVGPEKSQMTNYVLEFLKKQNINDGEVSRDEGEIRSFGKYGHTHLVAIPMEGCHQLLLELESIQRAILHHCPLLVHACIPQATTRLPLLYVTVSEKSQASTDRLFAIVKDEMSNTLRLSSKPTPSLDMDHDSDQPLMLHFQALDIDGSQNAVLHAVAKGQGSLRLRKIVERLQDRIHKETGWNTELPPDPNSDLFRARIPFMRLPSDWEQRLSQEHGQKYEEGFLTSDEGGNGISPIFWFKWEQDDFGLARMREVAVYQVREQYQGLFDEKAFYLPSQSMDLPMGGENMTKQEIKFRNYQNQRMLDAEEYIISNPDQEEGGIPDVGDDSMFSLMAKNRVESFPNLQTTNSRGEGVYEMGTKESDELSDWTQSRIREVISSRAMLKSQDQLARKVVKPPIEENEVFARYKNGTLAPKSKAEDPVKEQLPPFPSREHCCGFWRVVASPTGFAVEEGYSSRSDNLVLRVDGTTAGGPILDQETRQKASGGTWRFWDKTSDGQASLVIRLVIPPKKERILVMEGRLENISYSSNEFSLASSSFRIPQVEERKAKSAAADIEDMIYCNGDVWIEDAVTKANRQEIGIFSIAKINTPRNPDSYTITVPRPTRNQD
ncbi:hypothetical protein ACA910_021692 [Epithemia clementina (nom. ined.)]